MKNSHLQRVINIYELLFLDREKGLMWIEFKIMFSNSSSFSYLKARLLLVFPSILLSIYSRLLDLFMAAHLDYLLYFFTVRWLVPHLFFFLLSNARLQLLQICCYVTYLRSNISPPIFELHKCINKLLPLQKLKKLHYSPPPISLFVLRSFSLQN